MANGLPNAPSIGPGKTGYTPQVQGPSAPEVNGFHFNDDVDSGPAAHHHTLGYGPDQAMPGNAKISGISILDVLIKEGPAGVAANVFPAGMLVPSNFTPKKWILRCNTGHVPVGSNLVVDLKKNGSTIPFLTLTLPAGSSSVVSTTSVALAALDVIYFEITSAGSTTPAWDVAVSAIA